MAIQRAAPFHSIPFAFLVPSALAVAAAHAQPVFNPANGHYYEAVAGVLTWEDARSAAALREFAGLPGHLATLTDADESAFVIAALGGIALRGCHIGGYQAETCAGQNAGWSWVTGEPWSWTHWDSGEPNGPACGDRLELTWSQTGFADGRWNDIGPTSTNSSWVRGYLVEYEPPRLYFNPANRHYYERIDVAVTWDAAACLAASRSAHGLRGHLATITAPDELAWIMSTMGGADLRGFHLGGYQRPGSVEPAGGWTWITNEPWVMPF